MRAWRLLALMLVAAVMLCGVQWVGAQDEGEDEEEVVPVGPTPVLIPLGLADTLSARSRPTPTPSLSFPAELRGQILFLIGTSVLDEEDDGSTTPTQAVYALNPTSGMVSLLTASWPYRCALEREAYSANRQYRTFVRLEWFEFSIADIGYPEYSYALPRYVVAYYDREFNVINGLTRFGAGDAWDPVWSPTGDQIALVSNDSANDEIWVVTKDQWSPRQLTQNTWEWDKHPSWSPDGRQIAFMSNRTGRPRIWVMDADGRNQRPLTGSGYDARNPVWVKHVGEDGCP